MTPANLVMAVVLLGVISLSRVSAQAPAPAPSSDATVSPTPGVSSGEPTVAPTPPVPEPAPTVETPVSSPAFGSAPAPGPHGTSAGLMLSPATWTSLVVATVLVATLA